MSRTEPLILDISDTARWVAVYRARESERRDAIFRDPFARRLAGERGEQIADALPFGNENTWSFVMRTHLFDRFIAHQVHRGADLVVNLAAGLVARPYRMSLPASLQWVEVDLPGILSYKEEVLSNEKPICALERVRLDLSKPSERRGLFARLGARARQALIITEGLITYLSEEEVGSLAEDLAAPPSFQGWILDLASPGLLRMMKQRMGAQLEKAGIAFKFAPEQGPLFFARCGWKQLEVRSLLKTAAQFKRLPLLLRLMALLPESNGAQGSRPWGGACLLVKE